MRVVHLNTNREWGGGEDQVLHLLRALRERRVDVSLLGFAASELASRAAEQGLPVLELPARCRLPLCPGGRATVAAALRERDADVLHVHDSRGMTMASGLRGRLGLPVVLSRRVASPVRRNPRSKRKYSVRHVDAVIAISNTVKEVFARTGYPADRIYVVPSGLDLEAIDSIAPDPELRERYGARALVGGIGKLSKKKNWQFMVRVAARLAKTRERSALRWILCGEGPERPRLQALCRDLGVSDTVSFLGFRTDADRILRSLDVLFFPSVREGASVTVRKAMVMGVPVVAVDAPGTMESLAGHGWRVRDGDVEAGVRSVEAALDRGPHHAATDYARRHFSLERTVRGTLEVYRAVTRAGALLQT